MGNKITKLLLGIAITGSIVVGGFFTDSGVLTPDTVWIDGRQYNFEFTDDNTNENLIIRTDQRNYSGISKADVYFTVTNASGKDQNVDINFLFKNTDRQIIEVTRLPVTEKEITNYIDSCTNTTQASSTKSFNACEKVPGSVIETRFYADSKQKKELTTASFKPIVSDKSKDSANYISDKTIGDTIKAGEFGLYHAVVYFGNQKDDKFFIEVLGDKGGYGHLDPWFSSSWLYRKQITITGQSGAGTNYPVKLLIGETSGASGEDFDLGGNSLDFPVSATLGTGDSGDLRFTASDGTTELDFWVEDVTGTTPNRLITVWVEVAADLGSDQNIYVYYGNASASNASNGTNTFLLFDNFQDSSFDTGIWTSSGTISESGNLITIGDAVNDHDQISSISTFGVSRAAMWRATPQNENWTEERHGFNSFGGTDGAFFSYYWGAANQRTGINGTVSATSVAKNTNARYEIQRKSAGGANFYINSTLQTEPSNTDTTSPTITFGAGGGGAMTLDWVAVRKFNNTEPSFSSAAATECNGICTVTFSTSGYQEWTVPTNVSSLDIACWGGGGAGFTGNSGGGGAGGGGGAFASSTVSVSSGATIRIFVGSGGTSSGASGQTSTASSTVPTLLVSAERGTGGTDVTTGVGSGGLASNSTGTVKNNGGNGGQGANGSGNNDQGGGGGGAGGPGGAGNVGDNATASIGGAGGSGNAGLGGSAGTAGNGGNGGAGGTSTLGGGGGGGGDNGASGGQGGTYGAGGGGGELSAGNGADGACVISWQEDAAQSFTPTLQSIFFFE